MSIAETTVIDRELMCAAQRCQLPLGDLADKLAATEITVTRADARFMDEVVESVHRIAQTPLYQRTTLEYALAIAREAPQRVRGLFSGFDFHLTPQGPRLIEINTNAGGAFYGALIDEMRWRAGDGDARPLGSWSHLFVQHVRKEWELAGQGRHLRTIVIVDDTPDTQFLRFEFQLASRFLQEAGFVAFIADIRELSFKDGQLLYRGVPIDFVYNRLTSFALDRDVDRPLHDALRAGAVVVSPDPRTHALLACKRNLALLGDDAFLRAAGIDPSAHRVLLRAVPPTSIVAPENNASLWQTRSAYYFKPVSGFGSRAVYDGAKVTAKTWEDIERAGGYVAQARVDPPRTPVRGTSDMRFDVRAFAYGAQSFMRLARVYRGQTTNFRTPGGGFSPVRVIG